MPKLIKVKITTVDAELEFMMLSNARGEHLMHQVATSIGLQETWMFGLLYKNYRGNQVWIRPKKKVTSHHITSQDNALSFKFLIKFYPEDVEKELFQSVVKRMLFIQIKESILSGEIFCSPEIAVLLASYACQAKFDDYNPNLHHKGFLDIKRFIPAKVIEKFKYSNQDWEDNIVNWYKKFQGKMPDEAMLEYLKLAQDLEMYGVNYFEIKNKKGTPLWFGIHSLGVNIYEKNNKLIPIIGFQWKEIRRVSYRGNTFIIEPKDKKPASFQFSVSELPHTTRKMLLLCRGNQELYFKRRDPKQTDEQKKLFEQAVKEQKERLDQYMQICNEKAARETAEKQNQELQQKIKKMESLTRAHRGENNQYQFQIEELQLRLQHEQIILQQIQNEKSKIDEERQQVLNNDDISDENKNIMLVEHKSRFASLEAKERDTLAAHEATQRALEDAELKKQHLNHGSNHEHQSSSEEEEEDSENNSNEGYDLEQETEDVNEEQGLTMKSHISKNPRLKEHLTELSNEMKTSLVESKVNQDDQLHEENERQGRDKFVTLMEVSKGVTKKRIDDFDAL